ncbi:hypothetical protein [Microbacterium testaceum]|uniref:hypothetical protein n=1 Tax=Microbacterium testaceum TaxID=2033 RepID=UPI0025B14D7E|nr:hypothetical protein [Microbacterium testaceum]WJS89743.1 hypothetical protein NYQ11_10360 [Microbacterium testaceum]
MVVPTSWREAYAAQKELGDKLELEIKQHLRLLPKGWYTESRVKEPDSFNQKIETGKVPDFAHMEDFVGALVVVPLPSDVPIALARIGEFFTTDYRRPLDDARTEVPAPEFKFNDIRLYGHLTHDPAMPPTPLESIVFEIQVKTFFQHAWSTATHDLVYKYPNFSWSRSRVAAQVKAILEHAEMSLAALDQLEAIDTFKREGEPESTLNALLEICLSHWPENELPDNRKRMAESLLELCRAMDLTPATFSELMERGRIEFGGHPEGWSPYQCTVDYMSRYAPERLAQVLQDPPTRPSIIHVTAEVLQRVGLTLDEAPRSRT